MPETVYTRLESPVGRLVLAGSADALTAISFCTGRDASVPEPGGVEDARPFADAIAQLWAYFRGELRQFSLSLAPTGTPFQQRVWRALLDIPYGETVSYGEVARRIGQTAAVRAVGAANGRNPIAIVIPCHRVIGASGRLTGYGGGLPVKQALLALERRAVATQPPLVGAADGPENAPWRPA